MVSLAFLVALFGLWEIILSGGKAIISPLPNGSLARSASTVHATDAEVKDVYDGFNTPSVKCRLGMEKWQNENIDVWLDNPPYPRVEYVWELTNTTTQTRYYKGFLQVLVHWREKREEFLKQLRWEWQDQDGTNYTVPTMILAGKNHNKRLHFHLEPPSAK